VPTRPFDGAQGGPLTAQPLAGAEGASFSFWAPDGRAIGFFADGKLKRIDLTGGAPQVLADAPVGRGGTWNTAAGDMQGYAAWVICHVKPDFSRVPTGPQRKLCSDFRGMCLRNGFCVLVAPERTLSRMSCKR